jgi:ribonuclease I
MQKYFTATLIVALFSLVAVQAPPVAAQTSTVQQNQSLESIRVSVLKRIGEQNNDAINVSVEGGVFTVVSISNNYDESSHGSRNNEAENIVAAISEAILAKPEYRNITTINVLYQLRDGSSASIKTIDTVEFRKNQSGVFVIHTT